MLEIWLDSFLFIPPLYRKFKPVVRTRILGPFSSLILTLDMPLLALKLPNRRLLSHDLLNLHYKMVLSLVVGQLVGIHSIFLRAPFR